MQIGFVGTSQQNPLDCKNYQAGWNRPIVLTYPSVPHNMDVKNHPFFLDTLFQFFFTVSITFKSKVWMSFLEIISLDVHFFVQFSLASLYHSCSNSSLIFLGLYLRYFAFQSCRPGKISLKTWRGYGQLCTGKFDTFADVSNGKPVVVPALGLRPLSVGDPP